MTNFRLRRSIIQKKDKTAEEVLKSKYSLAIRMYPVCYLDNFSESIQITSLFDTMYM